MDIDFFGVFVMAFGAMMFAVAFTILIGRWVTAEENWVGVLGRTLVLALLFRLAFTHLETAWYWVCLILICVPMADELGIPGVAPIWVRHRRGARLSGAVGKAIEQPKSPFPRVDLGRALIETRQLEAGLGELAHAKALSNDGNRAVVSDMVAEVETEFLETCPYCGGINLQVAVACRHCLRSLARGLCLSALVVCCRPVLKVLYRRRVVCERLV